MASANNSPHIPYMAIPCQSGHMRSSCLAGVPPGTRSPRLRRRPAGPAPHRQPPQDKSPADCGGRPGPDGAGGWAQAGQRPGAGPERPQHGPLREPHTWRTPAGASGSAGSCSEARSGMAAPAASSEWPAGPGATRFLIICHAVRLRVLQGGSRKIFRSGSFTFAYVVPMRESNYEALLTLAAKFYCWRTHSYRRTLAT